MKDVKDLAGVRGGGAPLPGLVDAIVVVKRSPKLHVSGIHGVWLSWRTALAMSTARWKRSPREKEDERVSRRELKEMMLEGSFGAEGGGGMLQVVIVMFLRVLPVM